MLLVQLRKKLQHFQIDIEFEAGNEIIALFGPSGSGKTTILHCIAGLVKGEQGKIILNNELLFENGKNVRSIQERRIGYFFQEYALFPHMTVWKNIAYEMKNEEIARRMIEQLKIAHLLNRYPGQISGGERQRVAMTRALAIEPRLLLLDEPFSALDEKTRHSSREELMRIQQEWQIPMIIVTHDEAEAKYMSQRMIKIHNGKII